MTASSSNILLSFFDADWGGSSNPIIATTGSFTFRPSGTSFNRAVASSWFNLPTTLSGLTVGSATNTSGVLVQANLTVQGPVTLQGGNVYVYNSISAAGDILLDGDTGSNLVLNTHGVLVEAAVSTTAASNGNITLTGRGGNTSFNHGVYLNTSGTLTAGGSGSISVTGIGGANANNHDYGILAYSNLTTTTGSITLNGTGGGTGAGTYNRGIWLANSPVIKSTTGVVTLIGTGGVGANSEAIYVHDSSTVTIGAATQSGDITLRGNSVLIGTSTVNILTSGGLTIEPLGASFASSLSTQKFTLPALLASATLGKAGNTADITVTSAIATSGAITVAGGAVALNGALSSTGGDIGITTSALTGSVGITIPTGKTLTITQSGTSTFGGAISGGGSLLKAGAGTLALSASSGFTGTTTVSAGTLALGGGGTSGWLTGTTSIAVDGTLQIWRSDDVTLSLPLSGTGTVEVMGAYRPLFSSYLTTTAQTVASNTTVAEVLRRITGGQLGGSSITSAPSNAAAYQVAFDPVANVGRFQLQFWDTSYVKTVFVRLVQNGTNVQALVDQASPYVSGTAYTTLGSNLLGQNMETASGITYSMPLATSLAGTGYGAGRIDVASKTTLSDIGSFTGTLRLTTATETGTGSVVYTRTIPGVLEVTSGFGAISSVVNNGLLYLNQAANTTLPNAITGTGGVVKLGAGNTTFAAAASFTGETTVVAGRLTLQGAYGSSVHTILSGATLALDTATDRDYATATFRGTGTLVKAGAGRATWGSSVATFALGSGALIDVQGGTLTGNSNEVWTNNLADLNVASGATLAIADGAVRLDALTGAGDVTVGVAGGLGSLTLGVDNHTAGTF
ncbi:MAG: beta strand repeat-containing protein, partial [Verrucomicrobiota bacterium]